MKLQTRDSSIELLKVLAMVAIVFSHVAQSLLPSGGGASTDISYCIDYSLASSDPALWVLVCLRTLGAWGNTIFVIASAWYLCLSDCARLSKVVKLVLNVFAISMTVLILALVLGVRLGAKDVVKCFLPTTFANNWFVTCYILLYAIHPALNWVFERLSKRGHAGACVVLFAIYMLLPVVHKGHFFINELLIMVTEYALVAYGRYYLPDTLESAKVGWLSFLVGTLGILLAIVALEQAGIRIGALSGKMLHFDVDGNPLLFLSALGLFNLVRSRPFVSVRINRVASLMLLVYLTHENLIVRQYVRPAAWLWIYENLSYDLLFVWLGLFSVGLFVSSLFCAYVYTKTIGRATSLVTPRVEASVRRAGSAAIDRVCALG